MLYVTYTEGLRGVMWDTVYGPFGSRVEAEAHAATLSTDPNEGKVAKLMLTESTVGE